MPLAIREPRIAIERLCGAVLPAVIAANMAVASMGLMVTKKVVYATAAVSNI